MHIMLCYDCVLRDGFVYGCVVLDVARPLDLMRLRHGGGSALMGMMP